MDLGAQIVIAYGVATVLEDVEDNLQGVVNIIGLGSEIYIEVDAERNCYQRTLLSTPETAPPKERFLIGFQLRLFGE